MNFIKHVIFFVFLASLISCAGKGSYYVDDLNGDKSKFYDKKILLVGFIYINNSILYICSDIEGKQCIPVEASKKIYENLKELEKNKIHLTGKYVDHEFSDGGTNFLPSRFIVTDYSEE